MRKRMLLSVVLSLCMAQFGAFGGPAARGNARGGTNPSASQQQTGGAPVAARAGKMTTKANTTKPASSAAPKTNAASANAGIGARAAKKQTVKPSTGQPMAARAGATQKVIQTGSKVATATTNTTVPQECQDAFFGCMDAFCMLDNASGGRCQCSDRITELDKVLEDILKLDEQTYVMATEGVERIQMGEAEEQIMARAKAAGDKVTGKETAAESAKKARKLDLSAWNNNIFSEDDEEDIFKSASNTNLIETFADKKGEELYTAAGKMCAAQIPEQCKSYGSMVQLVYSQRIKSDCIAYENSLKQQKNASQQKLQTAQKALRDAALEEYNNQNKYGTAGECAIAFAQCMQTTAGCGSDYTGCVTLAAKENVASDKNGTVAKQTVIKGAVAGSDIKLAASTMEALLAKKEICRSVTKQCINSNKKDEVWGIFLRNAAPALKSAEEIAEQKLRMSCIPSVAECFKEACKSTIDPNDPDGSYDMCLSNPKTYKSLCKVQLEPCLAATGGTYDNPESSSLWDGLLSALAAMKVDACTKEVKDCLTSDNACGADYSACIGLSTSAIADLCPMDKLTACQTDNRFGKDNEYEIRDYVNSIAKGISLQIDNSLLATCQTALNSAMLTYCGEEQTCPNVTVSDIAFKEANKLMLCKTGTETCHDTAAAFSDEEILARDIIPRIVGRIQTSLITYDEPTEDEPYGKFVIDSEGTILSTKDGYDSKNVKLLINSMNDAYKSKILSIENDPKVQYCINGRELETTSGTKIGAKGAKVARFPNLTQSVRLAILETIMQRAQALSEAVVKEKKEDETQRLLDDLTSRMAKITEVNEAAIDEMNDKTCVETYLDPPNFSHRWGRSSTWGTKGVYNTDTNVCTETYTTYKCTNYVSPYCWKWDQTGTEGWTKPHPMKKWDGKTIVAQ